MKTIILSLLMFISPLSPHLLAQNLPVKNPPTTTVNAKVYAAVPDPLPSGVKASDWDLVIINRKETKPFPPPKLSQVDGKPVDARIASQTAAFLQAAQQINPQEHIISGYRSPSLQNELYNEYIQEEMDAQHISRAQAIKVVQTYSQPADASEHETGLAIDMSCTNSLNTSPTNVVQQIAAIAPRYGFVLRFTKDGEASTGIDYEDWHWRYVGVANAEYMTTNHQTLEQYVALLKK